MVWLPAGAHVLEPVATATAVRLMDFNGRLRTLEASGSGFEFSYVSDARAWASFDVLPSRVEVDEQPVTVSLQVPLPRGQHLVRVMGQTKPKAD